MNWILPTLAGIAIVVLIGGGLWELYHISYSNGQLACQASQATGQVKQDTKVKAAYDKVDAKTPFSANKRDAVKWLQQYTTDNGY